MEGWPSGLRRTPGKRVGVNASQGFESLPLRHKHRKKRELHSIMYVRIVKLTFMNDFSKEAASSLLVELGKTKGLSLIHI